MNSLADLNDIGIPDTVSMWPLAWGWWVVISLGLLVAIVLMVSIIRYYKKRAPIREAIDQLSHYKREGILDTVTANGLLKRVVMTYAGRTTIAPLHGETWVALLQQNLKPSKKSQPWREDLSFFSHSQYQRDQLGIDELYPVTYNCIKTLDVNKLIQFSKEVKHV